MMKKISDAKVMMIHWIGIMHAKAVPSAVNDQPQALVFSQNNVRW